MPVIILYKNTVILLPNFVIFPIPVHKSISMYEKTIFGNLKFEFEFDISTKSMPPMYMKHSSSK